MKEMGFSVGINPFANKRALGAIYLPQNEVDWITEKAGEPSSFELKNLQSRYVPGL